LHAQQNPLTVCKIRENLQRQVAGRQIVRQPNIQLIQADASWRQSTEEYGHIFSLQRSRGILILTLKRVLGPMLISVKPDFLNSPIPSAAASKSDVALT
jgi:hypothetical protein